MNQQQFTDMQVAWAKMRVHELQDEIQEKAEKMQRESVKMGVEKLSFLLDEKEEWMKADNEMRSNALRKIEMYAEILAASLPAEGTHEGYNAEVYGRDGTTFVQMTVEGIGFQAVKIPEEYDEERDNGEAIMKAKDIIERRHNIRLTFR